MAAFSRTRSYLPNDFRSVVVRARREVGRGVEAVGGAGGGAARAAGALPARGLRAHAHAQPLRARLRAPRPGHHNKTLTMTL